ncbi:34-kDa subunit of RNA polymerase III (C) [Loxospora ochrophaea]|nr:34-kDa subunit of RNA polymerase III (C) [Loxospora ochrophaea]
MASASLPPDPSSNPTTKELTNALYAQCASHDSSKIFTQSELLSFSIIPQNDPSTLHAVTTALTSSGLFKLMSKDGKACWRCVKKEDAAKYKSLSPEEALVYSYIESSAREGIWTRTIRMRTNLHQTVMTRCLKTLESKNYIKSVKNVKFPQKKTYMLAHLQPSEDVTGGPFYTDGVLDEEFVHHMAKWSERYIVGRSWWFPPPTAAGEDKGKGKVKLSKEQAEDLRSKELADRDIGRDRSRIMLPMPPGYTGYPTVPEITKAVNASGLSGVMMKEAEMRQLLDVLCWDGRLLKIIDGERYKAVRQVIEEESGGAGSGSTEAPCRRCPVFDLCEEGGPVNASNCEYFQDWLAC